MKPVVDPSEESAAGRKEPHPFVRGLVASTARLFNILSPRTRLPPPRTPEDDARNLYGDLERIGGDFDRVFAMIVKDARK